MGPMTAIVVLMLLVCLGGGLIIVVGAAASRSSARRKKVCLKCHTGNPPHANYCGHCGCRLGG